MSSTNRGATRCVADFYRTPSNTINIFLEHFKLLEGPVLEICAGDGAIVKELRKRTDWAIIANEIRTEENDNLRKSGANFVMNFDAKKLRAKDLEPYEPTTIITNPPFSLAQEILENCFKEFPHAEIIMLLRLNFLGSQKRKTFWEQHPVTQLYVLSQRPSFTGKGTDSIEYAWFVWSEYCHPAIKVI